jgi:uncharacterized protein
MSHQPVIDGFEFALAGATQQGILPVSDFPRLRDLLASDAGEVAYDVRGTRDARGRPSLRVSVRGTLQLRCQRCLEGMVWQVNTGSVLVLAATQAEIDADPADAGSADRVLAGKQMPVRELVEDEILLELPYAARHPACGAGPEETKENAKSPFAGLRGLMRSTQKH